MPRKRTTELKERAVAIAAERGPGAAAKETGIPAGTIRAWRSRGAVAAADRPAPGPDDAASQLRKAARQTYLTAMEARRAVSRVIGEGKTTGAKDMALAVGILLDQTAKLEAAAERVEGDRVRLDEEKGHLMVAALTVFCEGLGIPFHAGSASRSLLAEVLRSAEGGEAMSAPEPLAAEAREELHAHVLREARPALPAPVEADEEECVEEPEDAEVVEVADPELDEDAELRSRLEAEQIPPNIIEKELVHAADRRERQATVAAAEQAQVESWLRATPEERTRYLERHGFNEDIARRQHLLDREQHAGGGRLTGFQPSIAGPFRNSGHPGLR